MHIQLNQTKNTRSLSDLTNKDGLHIKEHLLIRSDNLSKLDSSDQQLLVEKYHLKRVIDLRCDNEAKDHPDALPEGVELLWNPILPSERVGVTKKGNDEEDFHDFIEAIYKNGAASSVSFMEKVYKEVVTSSFSTNAYKAFLRLLLEDVQGATLWHCSAGKDRAGFATILVLYLLDFSMEDIYADYMHTNEFYKENIEHFVAIYGESYRRVLETIFGVQKEYFDVLMNSIEETYESMEQYVEQGLGFSKEDRMQLKKLYLEAR